MTCDLWLPAGALRSIDHPRVPFGARPTRRVHPRLAVPQEEKVAVDDAVHVPGASQTVEPVVRLLSWQCVDRRVYEEVKDTD